ncbi:nuclear transport factor 2 family protein [Massilia scottii]|uniref:nuclear transport factor 2 family protein n=1 Tax=Massilia scottii TaxID=3057166 RepID=UPI0027966574|nr:nuclear transport factor 2 family protein [Massilia sp. CCM 9029]MDQ1833821.1 nuclear transport factor 2 family protein [Massilia sp. CCM 9029]
MKTADVSKITGTIAWGTTPALAQSPSTTAARQERNMNEININIAKTYIEAVQTGDQATLGSIISPDVIWHQPGRNRFSGTHRGMANVGPMLGAMMEVSKGTFAITRAEHYMASGEWVAITVEFAGEANGIKLKQAGVDLIRIHDGKIVEVRLFSGDQAQEDAFWGQ